MVLVLTGLNHITLAVADIKRSVAFYCEVLGFQGYVIWDNGAYLSAGDLWLCLSLDKPDKKTDYSHIAFSIEQADFEPYTRRLIELGVKTWKENKSEGDSFYLLDPDGHKLEVHVGDLQSRLQSLQHKPYPGLQWL